MLPAGSVGIKLKEKGYDSDDIAYASVDSMWLALAKYQEDKAKKWYDSGVEYWKTIEADYNGVLGGYDYTHDIDVTDNLKLINKLEGLGMQKTAAIGNSPLRDMGAGVGRTIEHVFATQFEKTDALEPLPHFMKKLKENLSKNAEKIGTYYETSMEKFEFERKYDLIWFQWVIGHLTDKDAVAFLEKCRENLNPGVISASIRVLLW